MTQLKQISTSMVLPLLEPVPIFHREEVRWGCSGGDAVYNARVLLNINPDDAGLDFAKGPTSNNSSTAKAINVSVFPNPAKDQLNILFTDAVATDAIVKIYGTMGNIVLTDYIEHGYIYKTLDVSNLRAGLYYYSITLNGEKISTGKVTILNK